MGTPECNKSQYGPLAARKQSGRFAVRRQRVTGRAPGLSSPGPSVPHSEKEVTHVKGQHALVVACPRSIENCGVGRLVQFSGVA